MSHQNSETQLKTARNMYVSATATATVPSSMTPLPSFRYLKASRNGSSRSGGCKWPPEKSVCLLRRRVPRRYLVTSGCSARAGVGVERATAPTTAMSETALRLESAQVAFRYGALLRRAGRIFFFGSGGRRHLMQRAPGTGPSRH
jgi:hypothetical protein